MALGFEAVVSLDLAAVLIMALTCLPMGRDVTGERAIHDTVLRGRCEHPVRKVRWSNLAPRATKSLLGKEFLTFVLEFASDAVGDCGKQRWEVELDLDGVGHHVDSAGDFLAESAAFEMESVAFPVLVKGDEAEEAAGHLGAEFAEAFGDAAAGFVFAELMGEVDGDWGGHGAALRLEGSCAPGTVLGVEVGAAPWAELRSRELIEQCLAAGVAEARGFEADERRDSEYWHKDKERVKSSEKIKPPTNSEAAYHRVPTEHLAFEVRVIVQEIEDEHADDE